MSNFKRFTDICAGFAAFSAFMYVFCKYMAYDFKEVESMKEKIKLFLEPEKGFSFYIPLILLFLFSCVFSLIFTKLPHLTMAVSVLPMVQTLIMFSSGNIAEHPMIYFAFGTLHIGGCLLECIRMDRSDRGRRAAIGTDLVAFVIVCFVVIIHISNSKLSGVEPEKMNLFQKELFAVQEGLNLSVFTSTAIMFAIPAILRVIWRDLYYFDVILSLIPLIITVYRFNADSFPVFGEVFAVLAFIYAVSRIVIMIFCKPKEIKKILET